MNQKLNPMLMYNCITCLVLTHLWLTLSVFPLSSPPKHVIGIFTTRKFMDLLSSKYNFFRVKWWLFIRKCKRVLSSHCFSLFSSYNYDFFFFSTWLWYFLVVYYSQSYSNSMFSKLLKLKWCWHRIYELEIKVFPVNARKGKQTFFWRGVSLGSGQRKPQSDKVKSTLLFPPGLLYCTKVCPIWTSFCKMHNLTRRPLLAHMWKYTIRAVGKWVKLGQKQHNWVSVVICYATYII